MMKTKKSSKGLALVLAAVLALTPMAGFPLTALATGDAATPKAEAPVTDAADTPTADAGETPQPDAPATDAGTNTDATPGTTPGTPAADAETPQAEAPATDATQPAAPVPATSAAIALTAPAAAVESAAASEGDVVIDEVNFPDPYFLLYVNHLDKSKDGVFQLEERLAVKKLTMNYGTAKSMEGIEFFPNLEYLYTEHSPLEYLDLSANKNLTTLTCFSNKLTNLDLSANEKLTFLNCSYTQITSLDLSHNIALTEVWCSDNPRYPDSALGLSSLKLPQSSTLTKLHCNNSKLTSLDVSSLPNLTELYCGNNQLTTLDLTNNTALTNLSCSNNQLTTLDLTGLNELGKESWKVTLSPQAPQIPVVKRGDQYELDLKTLAKGKPLTAITLGSELGSEPPVDLAAYQKMRGAAPTSLQYVCETGASGDVGATMTVDTISFAYSYPIGAKAEGNGSISWEGKSAVNEEFLVPENSTATFTIAPNTGSELASVLVDGTKVPSEPKASTYTFNDVTAPHAIAATFKEIPAPPVDPTDPIDPPKPPVDPADPINPPIPPAVPDNGGNGNNNSGTTIVERTNTVVVPAAPQAAALAAPETPATAATAAAKTEATPARAAADNAAPQGQLENPPLGAQSFDMQHSHLPLALLLLAVWLVGGFAVIRQRKHTHDAIDGASY